MIHEIYFPIKKIIIIRYFPVREISVQTSIIFIVIIRHFLLVISTRMIFSVLKNMNNWRYSTLVEMAHLSEAIINKNRYNRLKISPEMCIILYFGNTKQFSYKHLQHISV